VAQRWRAGSHAAHNFVRLARPERAFSLVSTPFEPF
jgi:hypothetical protein